jgi:hypothetical protein
MVARDIHDRVPGRARAVIDARADACEVRLAVDLRRHSEESTVGQDRPFANVGKRAVCLLCKSCPSMAVK